jgi:hypothetical protein
MIMHITNGDNTVGLIQAAIGADVVFAWQDVLYEGPLSTKGLDAFSADRAIFLADAGYGGLHEIRANFVRRNQRVRSHDQYDEIVLWFEHDTYDQLQLLQILHLFAHELKTTAKISLICINQWPGIEPFLGLGLLTPKQAATLFPKREPVTCEQMDLAHLIWTDIAKQDFDRLQNWIDGPLPGFPFLANALRRFLLEQPNKDSGLTHTQIYILSSVANGVTSFVPLFRGLPLWEGELFLGMGDLTFERVLNDLLDKGLLSGTQEALALTAEGQRLLNMDAT